MNRSVVLVIDGALDTTASLRTALRGHGHEVVHARSGPHAYDWLLVPDHEPAAIVFDWESLLASGCDFLSLLRRHPRASSIGDAGIPLVAWSARPPAEAHQAGPVRFVRNSTDPSIVVRLIDAVLRQR